MNGSTGFQPVPQAPARCRCHQDQANLERFLIIIEKANGNYSAYCPDLPGCVATGKTPEEVKQRMAEAIKIHLEGLREDNIPVPVTKSFAEYISLEI